MKKVLITGVNGLFGTHIAHALSSRGYEVSGMGRNERTEISLSSYHSGTILDSRWVADVLARLKPEIIIHLAGCSSVKQSNQEPLDALAANVSGSLAILDSVRKMKSPTRVVLASSAEVYAPSQTSLTEESQLAPKSTYALSKVMMEELGFHYAHLYACDVITLRYFYSIGFMNKGSVPPTIPSGYAYRIAEMEAFGSTSALRVGISGNLKDFIDIRDIVSGTIAACERGRSGAIYNICTGRMYSYDDIIKRLSSLSSAHVPYEYDESFVRPFEPSSILGSYERLNRDTGWQPEYDVLKDTLPSLLESWRAVFKKRL